MLLSCSLSISVAAEYKLPYPRGERYYISQGNGEGTHLGGSQDAWDFAMREGSIVVSVRSGMVRLIKNDSSIGGCSRKFANDGNYVVVSHDDGTEELYLHLQYNSIVVGKGDYVSQGQPIAKSGSTGWACGPHLHFQAQVSGNSWYGQSIPISFSDPDVARDNGIPRTGGWYTSSNDGFLSDRTLVQAPLNAFDSSRIYWLQNNKLYWVPNENIINRMNGMPGWSGYFTGNVQRMPNNHSYQGFPDGVKQFITTDYSSNGLLIVWKGSYGGDNRVYEIQNGRKRHIITEEAYYDYGIDKNDVIDVSGSILNLLIEGQTIYAVGQGASNPWLFKDCYRREPRGGRGGYDLFGEAYNMVHSWGSGFIQDFQKGADRLAITQGNGFNIAYAIYGGMWNKYRELAEQENRSQIPPSYLGYPTSDEREANPSMLGTKGRAQDFQFGHIHYHRTGKYAGRAFETHGRIDDVYVRQCGGSGSWLGFPVSDQYVNSSGHDQGDFEGGYITTLNGYNYNAYHWSSTATIVVPTSYTTVTSIVITGNNSGMAGEDFSDNNFTVNVATVAVDTSPPTLTISQSIFDGQSFTIRNVTVTGTAFDESGIQKVTVNGETAFGTTTWSKNVLLVPGLNLITVIAYDNSPNHNSKIGVLAANCPTQDEISQEPNTTASFQNYPNPFNPETWIPYQLSKSSNVVISIYDIRGCLVKKLDIGYQETGKYVDKDKAAYWDGRNDVGELVPSGVYFYNIQAGAFTATKKMVIQK